MILCYTEDPRSSSRIARILVYLYSKGTIAMSKTALDSFLGTPLRESNDTYPIIRIPTFGPSPVTYRRWSSLFHIHTPMHRAPSSFHTIHSRSVNVQTMETQFSVYVVKTSNPNASLRARTLLLPHDTDSRSVNVQTTETQFSNYVFPFHVHARTFLISITTQCYTANKRLT